MATKQESPQPLKEKSPPQFYFDVFALAVAKTESIQFTSDPTRWNQVIYDFKKQIIDVAPELLRHVCFDTSRPPLPHWSDEVDQFLRAMRMSRSMILASDFLQYRITKAVKRNIITNYSPKLQEWEDLINELAQQIDEKLAKHPPQGR